MEPAGVELVSHSLGSNQVRYGDVHTLVMCLSKLCTLPLHHYPLFDLFELFDSKLCLLALYIMASRRTTSELTTSEVIWLSFLRILSHEALKPKELKGAKGSGVIGYRTHISQLRQNQSFKVAHKGLIASWQWKMYFIITYAPSIKPLQPFLCNWFVHWIHLLVYTQVACRLSVVYWLTASFLNWYSLCFLQVYTLSTAHTWGFMSQWAS